jgi:hypothetical protein
MTLVPYEFRFTAEGVTLVSEMPNLAPRPATIVEVCLRDRVEELERLLRARQEHCRRVHGCEQEV